MHFRTQIPILKSDHQIDYDSKVVSLGSCFAVNIAAKLDYYKFRNSVNPFGILFHPLALESFLDQVLNKRELSEKEFFYHNEQWHSFKCHSDLSRSNKEQFLSNINESSFFARENIINATHILITLGTSWVYTDIESETAVANCHKLPAKRFTKSLLSVQQNNDCLIRMEKMILSFNPEVKIIFTISPVRHIKDGFVENQWSKSNLVSALQQFLQDHPNSAFYFPSYEIMMDELRDYRFYAEDMLHPNNVAIDYIWKRFSDTWISPETIILMQQIESIQKSLAHRPFNSDSLQHKAFLMEIEQKVANIQAKYPHINF